MEFEYETRVAGLQIALGSKAAKEGHIKSLKVENGYLQTDLHNEKAKCASLEKHLVELKGQLLAAESEIEAMKVVSSSREEKLFKCEREIVRIGRENYLLLEEIQKVFTTRVSRQSALASSWLYSTTIDLVFLLL